MLHPFGIRVQIIEPWFFRTGIADEAVLTKKLNEIWDSLPEEIKQEYGLDYFNGRVKFTSIIVTTPAKFGNSFLCYQLRTISASLLLF